MDQSDRAKELSEKTGFVVERCLDLGRISHPEWFYYSVFNPPMNVGIVLEFGPCVHSDPMFDMAGWIKREMDLYLDYLQAKKGHEGWQGSGLGSRNQPKITDH